VNNNGNSNVYSNSNYKFYDHQHLDEVAARDCGKQEYKFLFL
jgi:hypothetical protein